ncbi:DUF6230 family protein [Microbacterium ulmi]|uniref:Cholesterol esterase n=1 Tax=Microbacterium ulmi TaxID=179095 RepID=A0A7Y2M0J9_9MICO|nr:DUF6230 family protein [Microbacterium ulmi]NII69396.1 hypothetical protein [Microbacterium ulmi]NNH03992.1 cholesterol esterase [Microbacterium ulmi]
MKLSRLTATRTGRAALAAVPVGIVAAVLTGGVANGAVPVSFAVSGGQFKITASHLEGTGFSQYGGVVADTAGASHSVAISNIAQASLTDLCQSVVTETPLGRIGLMITAGGGGAPATATDLQIGLTDLQGDATFGNIRIGVDASTVATESKGTAGDFAQDSDSITIEGLKQTAWTTQAGVFTLTGLHLRLTDGEECF